MSNLALLQTVTDKGQTYWLNRTVKKNLERISHETSESIIKSDILNPQNAIFNFAFELINEFRDDILEENLTMYYFTNFGASVDCEIYYIPEPIFIYISKILKTVPKQWYSFVYRNYHIKGAKWDEERGKWIKKEEELLEENYKNNLNSVFSSLLNGKNILPLLKKYYRNEVNTKNELDSRIAIYYAKEVLHMKNEQLNLIKSIGNKIFELMDSEDNFKKYMVQIEGATRAYQLRATLLSIIKKNYSAGNEKPIVTLEEWVSYLFPDGQYWAEVRDLLLIYLYEKLHEKNMKITLEEQEIKEPEEYNEGA